MKKLNIITALILGMAAFTSCQNSGWDAEINRNYQIGNDTITERPASQVISIAALKEKYKNVMNSTTNTTALIEDDLQLQVRVVTNDREGNLSQMIVVTDGDRNNPKENLIINIADNDIWSYLKVGQKILVNLKGLYFGGLNGVPKIGYPKEKYSGGADIKPDGIIRIDFMTRYMWYDHFKMVGEPDESLLPPVVPLGSSFDAYKDCSRLVYVEGTFANNDGKTKLADHNKVTSTYNAVSETFTTTSGEKVIITTSTYADFSAILIPTGKVRVYGVCDYSTYEKCWEVQMRYASDIVPLD